MFNLKTDDVLKEKMEDLIADAILIQLQWFPAGDKCVTPAFALPCIFTTKSSGPTHTLVFLSVSILGN